MCVQTQAYKQVHNFSCVAVQPCGHTDAGHGTLRSLATIIPTLQMELPLKLGASLPPLWGLATSHT